MSDDDRTLPEVEPAKAAEASGPTGATEPAATEQAAASEQAAAQRAAASEQAAASEDPARVERIAAFWELARVHAKLNVSAAYFGPTPLDSVPPPAWSFGATEAHADELLDLVLSGTKTATASALWDYEVEGEKVPEQGELSIVLDGSGAPRALIETTDVEVVPFDQVSEEHAHLEGEGDRSLAHWREVHERFFTEHATHDRGFARGMPVVCERFRVLYSD